MEDHQLHIVYATDERYLLPTLVAVASAVHYASRPQDLVIDILDCDIPDSSWDRFEADMRRTLGVEYGLVRHRVDMSAYAQYKSWHTSRGIYARLSIPDILSDEVEWCVYADGDTLFVADPFELESVYQSQYALMGHLDQPGDSQRDWYARNGFEWDERTYLCAGFILLNLKWAREKDLSKRCFELINRYPDIPYNDQDALNILCAEAKALLPSGWGVFANEAYWRTTPCCIHYVGERAWELPKYPGLGLPATSRLWFHLAFQVARLTPADIAGFSCLRYWGLVLQSSIYRVLYGVLSLVPSLRSRFCLALERISCYYPETLGEVLLKLRGEKIAFNSGDPMEIPCVEVSDKERLCKSPLVSICMTVYNHEGYVRQALDGVMMQKTDFEYELIVGDDASTDRSLEICLEYQKTYPDRIRVLWWHENLYKNSHPAGGNSNRIHARCRGELIALCEGDDWWTDPFKLQKQVDLMRGNPQMSIVYTDFQVYHQRTSSYSGPMLREAGFFEQLPHLTAKDFLTEEFPNVRSFGFFATATILYRRSLLAPQFAVDPLGRMRLSLGDYQLRTNAALCGQVGFVPDACAVYRLGSGVLAEAFRRGDMRMTVDILYVHYVRTWSTLEEWEKRRFVAHVLDDVLRVERCAWRTKLTVLCNFRRAIRYAGIRPFKPFLKMLLMFHIIPQTLVHMRRRCR